jgi:hypothetical protein
MLFCDFNKPQIRVLLSGDLTGRRRTHGWNTNRVEKGFEIASMSLNKTKTW